MHNWFLAYCKPKQEARATLNLQNQGVDVYYPTCSVEKLVRGRRTIKSEPLFPNYLFVNFNPETISFTSVRSTRGISHLLANNGQPVVVPRSLVSLIQRQQSVVAVKSHAEPGDSVQLVSGCYRGLDAVYLQADGELRSILLVRLLGQESPISVQNTEFALA